MGCIIAIDLAARFPARALGITLLGAPVYEHPPRTPTKKNIFRREDLFFSAFEAVQKNPDAVQAGGTIANDIGPFIKGMEITEETWPAYKKSLEHTIMQYESYKQALALKVPTLFVNGVFDFLIVRSTIRAIGLANASHVSIKNTLGPHELTPRQGKVVARIINKLPYADQ